MKPGDDHTPTWAKALPVSEYAPTPNVIPVARLWQMYEAAQRCTRCGNNQVCRCFEPIGDQPAGDLLGPPLNGMTKAAAYAWLDSLRRNYSACMGGWCGIRYGCPNYRHGDARNPPSERLCVKGRDGELRASPQQAGEP